MNELQYLFQLKENNPSHRNCLNPLSLPSLSLIKKEYIRAVFDVISSNIDEVISIKPPRNVFILGKERFTANNLERGP